MDDADLLVVSGHHNIRSADVRECRHPRKHAVGLGECERAARFLCERDRAILERHRVAARDGNFRARLNTECAILYGDIIAFGIDPQAARFDLDIWEVQQKPGAGGGGSQNRPVEHDFRAIVVRLSCAGENLRRRDFRAVLNDECAIALVAVVAVRETDANVRSGDNGGVAACRERSMSEASDAQRCDGGQRSAGHQVFAVVAAFVSYDHRLGSQSAACLINRPRRRGGIAIGAYIISIAPATVSFPLPEILTHAVDPADALLAHNMSLSSSTSPSPEISRMPLLLPPASHRAKIENFSHDKPAAGNRIFASRSRSAERAVGGKSHRSGRLHNLPLIFAIFSSFIVILLVPLWLSRC